MNEGKGKDEAGRVQLGQGLQAVVKGENFILRAEGHYGWHPSGFCVQRWPRS